MQSLTSFERAIVINFCDCRVAYEKAEKTLDEYFLPKLQGILKEKNFDEAQDLLRKCPDDSLTKVFMMDAIRQAKRKVGEALTNR